LFCFHHAGGSAAMFKSWQWALGPRVDVVSVEIANRERFATLRQLVDEVDSQLGPQLDGRYALFGHSFGALVAYRLACVRSATDSVLPRALLLSSCAPPHLPPPVPTVEHLDNEQLAQLLSDLGGLPPELTQWPALRNNALDAARIDLRLCMTDDDVGDVALPCPIHVFGGRDDPLVSESDLSEWRSRTSGHFTEHILDGDHFYLTDEPKLFAAMRPVLSRL
jgi:surfactin synthase thioesterase subunit